MGVCHHGLGGNESHSSQASVAGRALGFLCHLTAIVGSDLTLFFFGSGFVPIQSVVLLSEILGGLGSGSIYRTVGEC